MGSSGEYVAVPPQPSGNPPRDPYNKTMGATRATHSNVEESTAALGRMPQHIEGLTEFLRKEYYRRMGIYLNGGRKEHGCLLNFWKDHVSETYKKLNEQKKAQ